MNASRWLGWVAGATLTVASGWAAAHETPKDSSSYVRLRRDAQKEPVALETAIATFAPAGDQHPGASVDLIAAIHIADRQYFELLNQRFRTYEAVLYELVAPEGMNVPQPGAAPANVVSGVQVGMKSVLGLSFQLDCIDYRAKNMVHADMSPEEFAASMRNRNESLMGMFFRLMGRGFADQSRDPLAKSDWKVLAALFADDRPYRLKLALAEQFADLDGEMDMFTGPEGSTIVTERNRKALAVLSRQLARGQKRIAIFYGAGHLDDMQQRLETDFGMKRVRTDWLPAWSLQREGKPAAEAQPAPAAPAKGRAF